MAPKVAPMAAKMAVKKRMPVGESGQTGGRAGALVSLRPPEQVLAWRRRWSLRLSITALAGCGQGPLKVVLWPPAELFPLHCRAACTPTCLIVDARLVLLHLGVERRQQEPQHHCLDNRDYLQGSRAEKTSHRV